MSPFYECSNEKHHFNNIVLYSIWALIFQCKGPLNLSNVCLNGVRGKRIMSNTVTATIPLL